MTTRTSSSTASATGRRRSGSRAARRRMSVLARCRPSSSRAGVEIVPATQIVSATCAGGRVREIGLRESRWNPQSREWEPVGETRTEPVDELVLALPPGALSALVRSGAEPIVYASPRIAEVARLTAQNVPLVHVYFNRKLRVPGRAGRAGGLVAGPGVHRHLADLARRAGLRGRHRARAVVLGPVRAAGHRRRRRRARDPRRGRPLSRVRRRGHRLGPDDLRRATTTRGCSSTRPAPTSGARRRPTSGWATSPTRVTSATTGSG